MKKNSEEKLSAARGYTLVELMVVIVLLGIGTGVAARGIYSKTQKRVDVEAMKGLINLASRRSLIESKHFGIHFNPSTKTAGLFEDTGKDNIYNNSDTIISIIKCNPNSSLTFVDQSNNIASDICFKKNGAVSDDKSYQLSYLAPAGDSSKIQIIAASGRILGP